MSNTLRATQRKHPEVGRGRGISKAKAKVKRLVRRIQNRLAKTQDDPVIEQPNRYRSFWWEWF